MVVSYISCLVLKVRGEAVDTELNLRRRGASYSILFYAAWCPFSSKLRPIFGTLSTMYPQIHHFTVEESSATPRFVYVESVAVRHLECWIEIVCPFVCFNGFLQIIILHLIVVCFQDTEFVVSQPFFL